MAMGHLSIYYYLCFKGHSGSISWMFVVAGVLTGLILVQCLVVTDIITQLRYQLNIVQSRSLPYPSKTFVGRQQELEELTKFITFSNDNFRIVNVVGAPGIGKSTLAIHVGHTMITAGVTVHYVDIAEFPDEQVLQVLAEKILESAEIITDKVGNFDRLLKWARSSYWNNLLILDNCDDALNYQKEEFQRGLEKLVEKSVTIKILMTSREISMHLDYLKQFKMYELSLESACNLLIEKVPVETNLTSENREAIANLTGKIPLALQIIASLLTIPSPPSPEEIILELEKHPIKTLSHNKLPANRQINASFSLSYKYLDEKLQLIGSYIANFPGSFTKEAAVYGCMHLVHGSSHEDQKDIIADALRSLVDRSLLEHSTRAKRFHYHRLIREFFHLQNISQLESFLSGFHQYYSKKLYEFAIKFDRNHKPSLAFLDTERHNIQLLFNNLAMQNINQQDEFMAIVTAVAAALDFDFLHCRFSGEELLEPLHGALTHFDRHVLKNYVTQLSPESHKFDCDYEHQILRFTPHRLLCAYMTLLHHLADIENQSHGPEMALRVYSDRKNMMESIKQPWNTGLYIEFLRSLAHYYHLLGYKNEEVKCHRHIVDHTLNFTEHFCKEEDCKYSDIAFMYESIGNNREAARFYELSLSKEYYHQSVIQKATILYKLCKIYEGLRRTDKSEEFFKRLMTMHPEVMNISLSQLFRYSTVMNDIVHLYEQHQKYDEASMLEEKLLESMTDIGSAPNREALTIGVNIARKRFHSGNYQKSIQVGQQSLKLLSAEKMDVNGITFDIINQQIKILIGRARFHSGEYLAGLNDLETIFMDLAFAKEAYTSMICKYLIFRPSKYFSLCSTLRLHPYTIFELGQTVCYLLLVPPLALTNTKIHLFAKPRQSLITSTEIITMEDDLEVWGFLPQIQFHIYIEQLIYNYIVGIIQYCTKFIILRLVINIASILFRLWMLCILCKFMLKFSRYANQHRCACLFIVILASSFLCVFLVAIVLPLYLLYLHRIK